MQTCLDQVDSVALVQAPTARRDFACRQCQRLAVFRIDGVSGTRFDRTDAQFLGYLVRIGKRHALPRFHRIAAQSKPPAGKGITVGPGIGVCVAARLGHEENGSGCFPQIGAGQAGCLCQLIQPAVDPAGMHLHPFEFMVSRQRRQKGAIGFDTFDRDMIKRRGQTCQCGFPVGRVHDQLGDHRVVVGRDGIAFFDAAVDAQARWQAERGERARRRGELHRRIFGVKPRLDRVAVDRQIVLHQSKARAFGNPQVKRDKVQPGDRFGDGMFHLNARVHLKEEILATRDQKFDRAQPAIVQRFAQAHLF